MLRKKTMLLGTPPQKVFTGSLTKTKNILELQSYLNRMKKEANLSDNLRQLGINIHSDYSKIISSVNLQRLKNNPINIERKDLKKILISL